MNEFEDFIKYMKKNRKKDWENLDMTEKEFKDTFKLSAEDEAKSIVAECFRNVPRLEELHSEDKISQEDMKTIMKESINRVYYLLWLKENCNLTYQVRMKTNNMIYSSRWDEPDIDVEEHFQKELEAWDFFSGFLIAKTKQAKKGDLNKK